MPEGAATESEPRSRTIKGKLVTGNSTTSPIHSNCTVRVQKYLKDTLPALNKFSYPAHMNKPDGKNKS